MFKRILFVFVLSMTGAPSVFASDENPLQSINGVSCGVQTEPNTDVVDLGTTTYLYSVNDVKNENQKITLNLKLEFLYCTKLNGQFGWAHYKQPYGLYAYTQRVYFKDEKWVSKGFWDTQTIQLTEKPLIYNVTYNNIKFSKLLTKEELGQYSQGKEVTVYLKLDLSSEKVAYTIGGYMVLKLTLSNSGNKFEVINK